MPYRENEDHVFSRKPAVFGDIAVPPPRKYELASAVFDLTSEQRMIGQEFQGAADAENPHSGASGILCGEEIEQAFEIFQRPPRYLDARHDLARGRRAFFPATRAAR